MIKFLDLQAQYKTLEEEIDSEIKETLRSAQFIGGTSVKAFEEEFSAFQSARHCIGVGNGTDAIEIALEVLELPRGSEVIVPANSFIASSEAVTRAGLRPVFADIDPDTYLVDLNSVRERIGPHTSAVIAVHLYGRPVNMNSLNAIAQEHGLKVVEDAAQAHGAEHDGTRVGALGDIGTFSFYPGKNLGAYGDGGAILTNSSALAARARMVANHGRVDKYLHEFEGRNSRLDGLQAAILRVKLRHLEEWTEARTRIADIYLAELSSVPEVTLQLGVPESDRHAYHLFVIRSDRREQLRQLLTDNGVETGLHYPVALTKQPAYARAHGGTAPVAESLAEEILSLPIGEHVSEKDALSVVSLIRTLGH